MRAFGRAQPGWAADQFDVTYAKDADPALLAQVQLRERSTGATISFARFEEQIGFDVDLGALCEARSLVAAVAPSEKITICDYVEKRWAPRRKADKQKNADADLRAMINHVLPEIGDEDVRTIPRDRLAALRDEWNARSGLELDDPEFLHWKTACNFWGLVNVMFATASHPDSGHADPLDRTSLKLHVREDNPCEKIKAPIEREEKQQPALWPNEADALLSCEDVPLHWRVLYASALYTGLRQSELRALLVSDVDLENDLISLTKKVDRKTGEVEHTKTMRAGYVPIEPALKPLLAALVEGRDATENLLWLAGEEDLAANVRDKHLPRAGVTRADLFARDKLHLRFTFHGLRHTHLTWRCGRGDSATDLMSSVLHADFQTTTGYIDHAVLVSLRRQRERLFVALPEELVAYALEGHSPAHTRAWEKRAKLANKTKPSGSPAPNGSAMAERVLEATPMGIEPMFPT